MVRVELTVAIERPPEEVFAYLIDLERLPEWQESALEAHADGPLAAGVHVHERRRVLGRELRNELEVTAFEPPRRLALRALDGPVALGVDHELAADGQGTLLRVVAQGEPVGFAKLAGPMVTLKAERELRRDFDRLKEILESR